MWQIKIKMDTFDTPIILNAKEVDLSDPFLVAIKEIQNNVSSKIIALPEDEIVKEFLDAEVLYFPHSSIIYAKKIKEGVVIKFRK